MLTAVEIKIAQKLTPQQKLSKALAMNDMGRDLLFAGIKHQNPGWSIAAINGEVIRRLALCPNRNY